MAGWGFPNFMRQELKVRGMAIFFPTLHVRKKREGKTGAKSATQTTRKRHRGAGIELSQIVLGLMCPGGLSRGGESQNEAKSRRFGMDMPSRAFYEG